MLVTLALLSVGVVATPLIFLISEAIAAPNSRIIDALVRPRTVTLTVNTLLLTAGATVGTLLVGVPSAFALVRTNLIGRRWWWVAASLPLAIPSYVAGMSWVSVAPLRGYWGSVLVLVLVSSPYVTLPVAAALRRADTAVEDVARTLGLGPVRAFLSMTLPQIAPAAGAGALLVALYTISEFGVVAVMRYPSLTPAVQAAFSGSFNRELAMVLSLLLVFMALLVVAAERALRRPVAAMRVRVNTTPRVHLSWRGQLATCAGLGTVFVAAVGVPIVVLLYQLSLSVAGREVDVARLLAAARTTVFLGFAGAAVATVLALPVGILAARRRTKLVAGLESATFLGHGLPGIVLGLSMVYLALAVLPSLYQTLGLLVIAYGILYVPKAMGSVRTSVAQVPPSLEDAARTLGRSPVRTWTDVTGKLAWPGIAAGAMLVALTVMKELPATLMMRPTGVDTLATRLWQLSDISAYGAAAPYALMLIATASIPALVLARNPGGSR
ncbi:iron ABC transporter permease [Corynebacterium testudinoris]|uniref:ABC-type Fe3+ transport system, permease component n=1 Tax=Corynebacterium testudinoris TaxID=136857 RepID=A0A0G3H7V3_9CORY|nr:ABC-type Fe3+ transport system, permease component [Corynebacterium testudinoris]MBX8996672.1 iron ABC transporter permease [Corynebacterium testudinoris]